MSGGSENKLEENESMVPVDGVDSRNTFGSRRFEFAPVDLGSFDDFRAFDFESVFLEFRL